jgi:hypothetical protein
MRTVLIVVGGMLLLGVCLGVARLLGRNGTVLMNRAMGVFIAIWFFVAAANLWIGVSRAGYSFIEELPIFLVILFLPVGAAALIHWKFS